MSHGVFHSWQGRLWAFLGAYSGIRKNVHTRAYMLDDGSGEWKGMGTVLEEGFWPMQQPLKMEDGNWIMSGFIVGEGNPPAVAISKGDHFQDWDLITIPIAESVGNLWGESTVMVNGNRIMNIARYGDEAKALLSVSDDFGRTWTPSRPTNLPMATSKPFTGTLSTGQNYLICSTSAEGGKPRSPLTIAVSRPNEEVFSKVFIIRDALFPDGPGESHEAARLGYPYAIEHDGYLYVGYSNNGGNVGRSGTGRELMNNNSAELAVIPVSELQEG